VPPKPENDDEARAQRKLRGESYYPQLRRPLSSEKVIAQLTEAHGKYHDKSVRRHNLMMYTYRRVDFIRNQRTIEDAVHADLLNHPDHPDMQKTIFDLAEEISLSLAVGAVNNLDKTTEKKTLENSKKLSLGLKYDKYLLLESDTPNGSQEPG
jgi:hypothetical protein